jgi:putative ubiquitin-RnfH superfamily antitoxin RatB of RatAB toxin-antitoxin module
MIETVEVEVVYALAERQWVLPLVLASGATVADALREAAASDGFADLDLTNMPVGVWGVRVQDRSRPLHAGDRIEVYRGLLVDPVTARRRAAASVSSSKPR